jgi:hypothetical protein
MFIKHLEQELTFCEISFWNHSQRLSPIQLSLEKKSHVRISWANNKEKWKQADVN